MTHKLIEVEDDIYGDGPIAVCACGWKSEPAANMPRAIDLYREHYREHSQAKPEGTAAE